MLRRLYEWALSLVDKPHAIWVMAGISFADSSFLPLPPDFLLIPMSIARPKRALTYAIVCTIASVLGAVLGYAIGAFLWDTAGQWLIKIYHLQDKVDGFRQCYSHWGGWVIVIKGFTPIPYKLVTIVSGFAGYSFLAFVVLSFITRGARFLAIAVVLNRFGDQVRHALERHLITVVVLALVILAGGMLVSFYVHLDVC
ncbi:MAG: DedA family protein [Hyphomicrobiales bacterium]|nr:DedA family protein [Hyphomicrobiales bacterium]